MKQPSMTLIPRERWWQRDKFRIDEDYYDVKKGFITDGLSIPFGFRWLFPPLGRAFGAGVLHDWNLQQKLGWRTSNIKFEVDLYRFGLPQWRINGMVWGVNQWAKWKMKK